MSMVSGVVGGVDTHADVHVAAALDTNGGLLGIESFPTNEAGYRSLADWLAGFGPVVKVGVEGTGSYGVGLARHLHREGVVVVEVDRPDRQKRRRPPEPTSDRPIRPTGLPPIPHLDPLRLRRQRHNNLLNKRQRLSPRVLRPPPETAADMGSLEAESFVAVAPVPERDGGDVFVGPCYPRGTCTSGLAQVQLPDRGGFK